MMYYVSIHVFKTKMPNFKHQYMKHNIKVYKTMIQLSIIFSTIAFYYECCKSGRKERERERGSGVGGNSKSGRLLPPPLSHPLFMKLISNALYCS